MADTPWSMSAERGRDAWYSADVPSDTICVSRRPATLAEGAVAVGAGSSSTCTARRESSYPQISPSVVRHEAFQ